MMQRQRTFRFHGILMSDSGTVDFTICFNNGPEQRIQLNTSNVNADSGTIFYSLQTAKNYTELLYEQDLSIETTGYIPVTVNVHSGSLYFAHVTANYVFNPDRPWSNPRISFSELLDRKEDPKKNVMINGEMQQNITGRSVLYCIQPGTKFECDISVDPTRTALVPAALYHLIINKINLRSNK